MRLPTMPGRRRDRLAAVTDDTGDAPPGPEFIAAQAGYYADNARTFIRRRDEAILRAHDAGASLREIADAVGMTAPGVAHIIKTARRRSQAASPDDPGAQCAAQPAPSSPPPGR